MDALADSSCRAAVLNRLKTPATAKFSENLAFQSDSIWAASGAVDAENLFGAMVRHRYSCDMEWQEQANLMVPTAVYIYQR